MAEPLTLWKALVVDEVNEEALMAPVKEEIETYPSLPVAMVKVPADDAAVLSWRWDGHYQVYGSKNVLSALRCAKQIGVRYLFVDAISIDQQLSGDALIKKVVDFSTLYKAIQVIAAYDTDGSMATFIYTCQRPWIVNEMRIFTENPVRISYAGHSDQGAQLLSKFNPPTTLFQRALVAARSTNFEFTILSVLCGRISMCSVSDFKVIIPAYGKVLGIAYEHMSRNDYLLTAAMLLCLPKAQNGKAWHDFNYLDFVTFDRYTHAQLRNTSVDTYEKDIHLDTKKLATLKVSLNGNLCYLTPLPDADRIIFAALGLSGPGYEEFAAQEDRRPVSALTNHDMPTPEVDVFSINLDPFW